MPNDVDDAPLVGRAGQLQILHTALLDVEQGFTSAVFLTGEAGIGKTRLLREAARQLHATGAVVLTGACLDIGDSAQLHPLRQALRRLAAGAGTDPGAPAVSDLLRQLDHDPGAGEGALLERIARGLGRICRGRVLVLLLDDLQWVDEKTRQLLLYLLAGLSELRLLVIGAVRAETMQGVNPMRQVLSELRRLRSVRVLELPPLNAAETEQLATLIVGRPLPAERSEQIWKRSSGLPFVVEELARDVREGHHGLSETLREVLLGRVDALPGPARAVVYAVAVGVEPVGHQQLATVLRMAEDTLLEALRAAVAQWILTSADDGYRLRHRVIAEVLEPELLPAERARLHRRHAEALLALAGGADSARLPHARLAHHFRHAGQWSRAIEASTAAAAQADSFAQAYAHWMNVVDLVTEHGAELPAPPDREALIRSAAEAAHNCGEHASALALIDRLTTADAPASCALAIRRARYLAAAGRIGAAEEQYARALAAGDCTEQQRLTATAHLAELLVHLGRYAEAGERALEALEQAEAVDDAASEVVLASAALGYSHAYREDPDVGLAHVRKALETAERTGRPDDIGCAYQHLAELLTGPLNELEEGIVVARRGADRAVELGVGRTYGTRLLAVAAMGLFRTGQWGEAEKVIAGALRHGPAGLGTVDLLLARCRLFVGYGEFSAAERDLDAVATLLAGGDARSVLPLLTLRAGLAMWRGRHAEARAAVRQVLASSRSDDAWQLAVVAWHGLRAEAEGHTDGTVVVDPAAVRQMSALMERVSRASAGITGPVRSMVAAYQSLCDGELSRLTGEPDPAVWEHAAELWQELNHPYPAAYAWLHQAEAMFLQRTRNAAAAEVLRQAHRTVQSLGAQPLAAEIRELAAHARVCLKDTLVDPPRVSSTSRCTTRPGAGPGDGARAGTGPRAGLGAAAGAEVGAGAADPFGTTGPAEPPESAEWAGHAERSARLDRLDRSRSGPAGSGLEGDPLAPLTARELEVLKGVAEGLTNREIARRLFISDRTIGVHVSRILDKLQVRSRVHASRIYLLRPSGGSPDQP